MCAVELDTAIDFMVQKVDNSTVLYLVILTECLRYHKSAHDTLKKTTEPHRRT